MAQPLKLIDPVDGSEIDLVKHFIPNQCGFISLPTNANPFDFLPIFANFIPTQIICNPDGESVTYAGLSPLFDELEPNDEVPAYQFTIEPEGDVFAVRLPIAA